MSVAAEKRLGEAELNAARARRAERAVCAYHGEHRELELTPQRTLSELLTDLRHLAARSGLSFGAAVEASELRYCVEALEEAREGIEACERAAAERSGGRA